MNGRTLADLVGAGPLLLDFDGPVCSIFAGYPAPRVAAELVALGCGTGQGFLYARPGPVTEVLAGPAPRARVS